MKTIWIFSGESSGDLYGAHLAAELKQQQPDVVLRGMGAQAMREAGVDLLVDSSELGVVGLVEVFKHLRMFLRLFKRLVARAAAERPDAVVLIDYPGFNLRFAKQMRKLGIPVVYYISPQVWAWGKKRIPEIARDVTRMLVIFPFEPQVYAGTGLDVCFVGHPLKEILAARRDPALVRTPDTVLLLPGSRNSELDRLLAPFVATAAWLKVRNPQLKFVLATPNARIANIVTERLTVIHSQSAIRHSPFPDIEVVTGRTQEWMQRAACGLAASGTVTMECAMLGLPLAVAYRMNPLTVFLGRLLVQLPYFTIVNLVANRCVFQEFLQGDVCPKVLGPALEAILPGGARRAEVEAGMSEAVAQLGERTNASALAATAVLEIADGTAGRDAKLVPQRANWKRRLLWTLTLLVLLPVLTVAALAVAARIFYPWPEPPPGMNLTPLYPAIPKAAIKPDNAAYYLMLLQEVRIIPVSKRGETGYVSLSKEPLMFDACGWEAGHYPDIEAALNDFGPNAELLRQAAAAPNANMPLFITSTDTLQFPFGKFKNSIHCLCIRAEAASAKNEWGKVADSTRLGFCLDNATCHGGVFINRLVAIACDAMITRSLRRAVEQCPPPPEWLRQEIAEIAKAEAETVPFEDTLRNVVACVKALLQNEYLLFASEDFDSWPGGHEGPSHSNWSRLQQLERLHLLICVNSSKEKTPKHLSNLWSTALASWYAKPAERNSHEKERLNVIAAKIRMFNDPIGHLWNNSFATKDLVQDQVQLWKLSHTRFITRLADLRGTSLILALRLYQLEHDGKLPAKLEELVAAGCMKTLPDDPFAPLGTTFGYRANKDGSFAVWSRGKDLKDDGGNYDPAKAIIGSSFMPDIVFPSTEARDRRAKWQKEHKAP